MRTFELQSGSGARLEGVVFCDGSISVRRVSEDPCERITFTFEGVSECESELGISVPEPEQCEGYTVWRLPAHAPKTVVAGDASADDLKRAFGGEFAPRAPVGVYAGDGHPLARAMERVDGARLDRRLLEMAATPCRYSAEDNEPEPEV